MGVCWQSLSLIELIHKHTDTVLAFTQEYSRVSNFHRKREAYNIKFNHVQELLKIIGDKLYIKRDLGPVNLMLAHLTHKSQRASITNIYFGAQPFHLSGVGN